MGIEPTRVPLSRITIDPALQPRVGGQDGEHIRALQEAPDRWPPIVLAERGDELLLVDGHGRLAAARAEGLDDVLAEIRIVPGVDLLQLAFELNSAHGRALTLRDRRRYAEHLLNVDPLVSNEAIAGRSGLSPTTVAKVRQDLEAAATIPETSHEPGSTGRSYAPGRRSGELPEQGLVTMATDAVAGLLSAPKRGHQRRVARYLERLAVALTDRAEPFAIIDNAQEVAEACFAVLGEVRSEVLARTLGEAAFDLRLIAEALGYQTDPEA